MAYLSTRATVSTVLLLGLALFAPGAQAQQSADDRAIVAAVDGFNAALSSRDLGKMEAIWAQEPYVMLANPRDKAPSYGPDAVKKGSSASCSGTCNRARPSGTRILMPTRCGAPPT